MALSLQAVRAADLVDTSRLGERGVEFEDSTNHAMEEGIGIGDFNGDGFDDVAVPVSVQAEPVIVATTIVFGRPDLAGSHALNADLPGTVRVRVRNQDVVQKIPILSRVGDVNEDGYADLWIGYSGFLHADDVGRGAGYLAFGSAATIGADFFVEDVGQDVPGMFVWSSDPGDNGVGRRAATLQDFDGDGRVDLAVTAGKSTNLRGELNAGALFIISDVRAAPRVLDLARVGRTLPGTRFYGTTRASPANGRIGFLGYQLSAVGDFDGDGLSDVLVSSVEVRPPLVYLIRGRRSLPAQVDLYDASEFENITVFQMTSDNRMPGALSAIGDLNADGLDDILIGISRGCCPSEGPGAPDGAAYLFYGGTDFPPFVDMALIEQGGLDPDRWRVVRPIHAFSQFPFFSFGGPPAGDFNQDGVPDFLVSSPAASVGGNSNAGEAYVVFGRREMPQELRLGEGFDGIRILGNVAFDRLGEILGSAGDFNGDGALDILVVARFLSSSPGVSRAYLIYGSGASTPPLTLLSATPASGSRGGGTSVVLRGSGFEDLPIVRFGGAAATNVTVLSTSELRVTTPPSSSTGVVSVTVTVRGVTRTLPGGFEYTPNLPSFDLSDLDDHGFVLEGVLDRAFAFPAIAALEFGDLTGDGIDELIAEATEPQGWRIFIVRGGRGLPPAIRAYEPSTDVTVITTAESLGGFGATVTVLGDVDGGGATDLGIGASNGVGYLVFGEELFEGAPPAERYIEDLAAKGLAIRLEETRNVGNSIMNLVSVGDLTGDGIADFAVGHADASVDVGESLAAGEILYVAGRRRWQSNVVDLLGPDGAWARIHGERSQQRLAERLRDVGDVNGDGFRDLLADTLPSSDTGSAFLLFGRRDPPANAEVDEYVEGGGGVRIEIRGGFGFNWFNVAGAGDVNADGYDDILVGVESGGEAFQGVTYLIFGSRELPTFLPVDETPAQPDSVVRVFGEGAMEQAGRPGRCGDFNVDGYADFIIGAPGFQQFGQEAGNVFVVFGADTMPDRIDLARLGSRGIKIDGRNILGGAGFFAGPAGDLNGDGLSDFAFSELGVLDDDPGYVYVIYNPFAGSSFVRGDANFDDTVDIADAVFVLGYLFLGGRAPLCEDAADADDNGRIEISDGIRTLNHLFLGTVTLPAPYPEAGEDPSPDGLSCLGF
jgi:hypothetical protein